MGKSRSKEKEIKMRRKILKKRTFFSKNRTTALNRLKKLSKSPIDGKYYKNKTVKLAKKQIKHISGWKTWQIINKKR